MIQLPSGFHDCRRKGQEHDGSDDTLNALIGIRNWEAWKIFKNDIPCLTKPSNTSKEKLILQKEFNKPAVPSPQ
jgi:hypothetical protein